jgi:hypothetical protein
MLQGFGISGIATINGIDRRTNSADRSGWQSGSVEHWLENLIDA